MTSEDLEFSVQDLWTAFVMLLRCFASFLKHESFSPHFIVILWKTSDGNVVREGK